MEDEWLWEERNRSIPASLVTDFHWWGPGNEATVSHLLLSSKERNEIGEKCLTVALQSGWLELLPVGGCGEEGGGGDKVGEIAGRPFSLESSVQDMLTRAETCANKLTGIEQSHTFPRAAAPFTDGSSASTIPYILPTG